jgi:hypothetical protein
MGKKAKSAHDAEGEGLSKELAVRPEELGQSVSLFFIITYIIYVVL